MGIFTNNIIPIPPTNMSWNKIGYEEWITILNQKYIDLQNSLAGPLGEWVWRSGASWNKNELKRKLHQMKRLNRELQESIDKVQDAVYQKYGVWVKYKIQYGDNKQIKSIVFNRFC